MYELSLRPALVGLVGSHDLVGVEIGSYEGLNALSILMYLDVKKIYLIDPYLGPYIHTKDDFYDPGYIKYIAHTRLEEFKDKIVWLEMKSDESSKFVTDKLDFIYIDGNHKYNAVMKDLFDFYPKMKKGAIMGGHDFELGEYDKEKRSDTVGNGVREAVMDFFYDIYKNDAVIKYHIDPADSRSYDWWVVLK